MDKKFSSISKELLKVVFAFYFSITIIMTLAHFTFEYYNTQDNIKDELQIISKTFEIPYSQAMWNYDVEQISSISQGAIKLPNILGVEIYDKITKEKISTVMSDDFNKLNTGVFSYNIDITHTKTNNEKIYIGTIKYYSSSDVVFQRVQLGFTIILINSLIKSLILTILFIWAFRKYLTKPLEDITKNISDINLDSIHKHKPLRVSDKNNELTILSNAFNEMLLVLNKNLNNIKSTQKYLVQSEKMVALGGMVAGVAHEINTPVGMALTGITHLDEETKNLKKLYEEDKMSQDDFEEYLKDTLEINSSIEINLQKAASLVRSFKKVAVDQSSNEIRTFELHSYIEEILLSLKNKTKQTNITIDVQCDKGITIKSNPGAISQIITNFTMNSIIHAFNQGEEGSIIIKAYLDKSNNLNLIYKDNGKGLSDEVKSKIFDPFFTTKRREGGSGLGMSIVYNLVTSSLNGSIHIQSEENMGTQFNIKIPLEIKG